MPEPKFGSACNLPSAIHGWVYDPEDRSNGLVWRSSEHDCAVGIWDSHDAFRLRVLDDRVRGFGRYIDFERVPYEDRDERGAALESAFASAHEWMADTHPSEWTHPGVCEAVFDAPVGYDLEVYYLESSTATVYYRRQDFDGSPPRSIRGDTSVDLSFEDAPYLFVETWRSSGNSTVALAPWPNAHGPSSKHPEVREIAETPAECGLEVAVTVARQVAREHLDGQQSARVGQQDLGTYRQDTRGGGRA